jgi:outer membrane cobalamin receptor
MKCEKFVLLRMAGNILFAIMIAMVFPFSASAGEVDDPSPKGGVIRGFVIDAESRQPIEYATIAVFPHGETVPLTGAVTETSGRFRITGLNDGVFDVEISFMGYKAQKKQSLSVKAGAQVIDLGQIMLVSSSEKIEQVDVVATRNSVEYKLDKKVVTVSKQLSAASMSAVEVLENVPSVKVDLEGNVSLRGSSSFTVLIDGRPSILDPSDALKQIPASSIENIEIITNPSVKYAPDGTSGIINIILKKNRMQGIQGQISANVGRDNKYGTDVLLSMRKNRFNFTLGGNFDNMEFPGFSYSDRTTFSNNDKYNIIADGERRFQRQGGNVRFGVDYDLTEKDVITIGGRIGKNKMNHGSELKYTQSINGGADSVSWSEQDNERKMDFYSGNISWQHNFDKKGHNIITMLDVSGRSADGGNESFRRDGQYSVLSSTRNVDDNKDRRTELKIEYTLPFSQDSRFEAGFQGRLNSKDIKTDLYLNDVFNTDFSNSADFRQDIYSTYVSYSGKLASLGYQAGFRTELLDREIEVKETGNKYTTQRWDFFPTVHLSYQLPKEHQLMLSYTRRTARMWDMILFPFLQYVDDFNVRTGDPDLKPSLIDSWEAGYIKQFKNAQFSAEVYHRVTHDKTEFILGSYENNVAIQRPMNIGKDYSTGIEGNLNFKVKKVWEPTIMASVYHYKVNSYGTGSKKTRESNNWDLRFNNNFLLMKNLTLQANANYSSPTVNAQGTTEDYYSIDGALRMEFMQRKLSAVFQIRDIFQTSIRESTIDTESVKAYTKNYNRAPMFSFTVTYRLNDFKPKRNARMSGGGDEMEGMEGF